MRHVFVNTGNGTGFGECLPFPLQYLTDGISGTLEKLLGKMPGHHHVTGIVQHFVFIALYQLIGKYVKIIAAYEVTFCTNRIIVESDVKLLKPVGRRGGNG